MRHLVRRVAIALVLPAVLAMAGPVAASRAPSFSISFAVNMDSQLEYGCFQTAKATWKNTRVDSVTLSWHIGYSTDWLVATGTAPGTGPYDGVMKGRSAAFRLDNLRVLGPPPTDWHITAAFYSGGVLQGEAVLQTWSLCAP